MRRKTWIVVGLAVLLLGGGLLYRRSRPAAVAVVLPNRQDVTLTLAVTGRVETVSGADLSSPLNGVLVRSVLVDIGDRVRAGQPLVMLDDADLRAAAGRARAGVRQAEAGIRRAAAQSAGAGMSERLAREDLQASADLRAQRDRATAEVSQARARLSQSRAAAARVAEGAREETVRQAEARIRQAETEAKQAERALERRRGLFEQGAIAREVYEEYADRAASAAETLRSARLEREQLAAPRTEDVRQAEALVREAEAALRGADAERRNAEDAYRRRIAARQSLARAAAERDVAATDIGAANADLAAARAERAEADANLARTVLRSPMDGIVTARSVEPGETVNPGKTLLSLAGPRRLRVSADIDETDLKRIRPGQTAVVSPDAFPDVRIPARLDSVGVAVDPERGTVEARFDLLESPDILRPDLTVDINVITGRYPDALTLPRSAVREPDTRPHVLVVEGGRAREKDVRILEGDDGTVVVRAGLDVEDRVVAEPARLKSGQRVEARG